MFVAGLPASLKSVSALFVTSCRKVACLSVCMVPEARVFQSAESRPNRLALEPWSVPAAVSSCTPVAIRHALR